MNYDANTSTNLLLDTDSYKASHWLQYPEGTTSMYSYLESRGGKFDSTLFFGLQYYIKQYLLKPITREDVFEAEEFFTAHGLPFNTTGFLRIVDKHGGFMPIKIKAVPEGTVVPTGNILMSVESTDPECFWVPSYLETLLMRLWYPVSVGTVSWYCKKIIMEYLEKTSTDPQGEVGFKLHDFGSRGVSSRESAGIGGAAHLVNFMGSDTVWGVKLANDFYNHKMSGFSIPACYDDKTEILTATGWKLFSDLKDADKVAQFNPDETIEFVVPEKIITHFHDGEMYHFTTKSSTASVDLLVTPEHRMLRKSMVKNEIEIFPAEKVTFSQRNQWLQAGKVVGTGKKTGLSDIDRLKIAFQADGSFASRPAYTGARNGTMPIRFSLKKERKQNRLEEILRKTGFDFSKTRTAKTGKKKDYFSYWVAVPIEVFDQFQKTFDWIKFGEISSDWCEEFIEELGQWDGCVLKGESMLYSTTNDKNAHIVQILGTLCGKRASISVYKDPRENRKPCYTTTFSNNGHRNGQGIIKTKTHYNGNVYCVTVPSGMVIVRRNNKVSISGNSEHSTMTMLGRDGELTQFKNMLDKFAKPGALVAVVSDSYDLWNAIDNYWGEELKQQVIESGATLVVRPDSGTPVEIVSECLKRLENKFGATYNNKGYKVLNHVRLIQGDGCTIDTIRAILNRITNEGYSASNLAFGMGGGLLQKVDRDTQKFAYKCSSARVNGKEVEVFKDPITDPGKKSKAGKLDLVKLSGQPYQTVKGEDNLGSVLRTVYENGKLLVDDDLETIRKRSLA